VFEPRTATSKRRIFEQRYVEALALADRVLLTPLYRQDKVPEPERLSLDRVVEGLRARKIATDVLAADAGMVTFLKEALAPGDVVLFMSNGDFNQIPANLLTVLS